MNGSNIRVLIPDLDSASHNELARQLEDHPYIKAIGQAAHRRQVIRPLQQLIPDLLILILDISSADNIEIMEMIMATGIVPILAMRFCPEN